MLRRILLLLPICFLCSSLFAQEVIKAVKADQQMSEVFTVKDLYRYEQFVLGKVLFRDGTIAEAKLNYNKLFGQMLFINENGDSLAVGNPETIKFISIGSDTFYCTKDVYLELVSSTKNVQLAKRQLLQQVDEQKNGAYGQSYTNNSTVSNKNYYTIDGKPRLNVGESTLFSQKTEYFISYKQSDFVLATKRNIEKLFADKSQKLKEYMKDNAINTAKEQDLEKLIQFMQD